MGVAAVVVVIMAFFLKRRKTKGVVFHPPHLAVPNLVDEGKVASEGKLLPCILTNLSFLYNSYRL